MGTCLRLFRFIRKLCGFCSQLLFVSSRLLAYTSQLYFLFHLENPQSNSFRFSLFGPRYISPSFLKLSFINFVDIGVDESRLMKGWGIGMSARELGSEISVKALIVWRIIGVLHSVIILGLLIGDIFVSVKFGWPIWTIVIGGIIFLLYFYCFGYLFPYLKWKRWRYEVREVEIELQHGMFFRKRTLVPMVRVQHVDTVQGPLLRKYGLATVTISTAATVHEIPAIDIREADELRSSISSLARVAEDDV